MEKKIVSSWTILGQIKCDEQILIWGTFEGWARLGLYWVGGYPNSRGYIAPLGLQDKLARHLLTGLQQEAIANQDWQRAQTIQEAWNYLFENNTIQRLGSTPRLSEAVVGNGMVFLSGMVPENPEADIGAQTENVLQQIDDWLAKSGSDKTRILEATIYLPDLNDYDGMNAVWDKWVHPEHTPARACVEAKLAKPEWKVEIKVSALVK